MYNPRSTYRIQFNKDYTLQDLERNIEYLSLLGIGTLYASPIFKATPGSGHGYDTTDPLVFNPEITSLESFVSISRLLRKHNIGWLQDLVSNHMAFHPDNAWLMDVLEKGHDSLHHGLFDLEPGVASRSKKMMIPFLGETLDEAIENGNIKLGWKNGSFTIGYYDNVYPVNFPAFREIFSQHLEDAPHALLDHWDQFELDREDAGKEFLNSQWEESKAALESLMQNEPRLRPYVENILQAANSNEQLLRQVLEGQYYELCHWQETEKRINYRRFFTVNSLICLRMEDQKVFERYHALVERMIQEGHIQGLRIDHIDGLNNPNEYLNRLRALAGENVYIVAEKILEYDEELPEFWPIQGNTGYDFLATVNNLFTSTRNYDKLRAIYKEVTHVSDNPADLIYQNKKMILTTQLHGEWDNLLSYFDQLEFVDYQEEGIGWEEIKEAIGEFMLACPVYRLYPRQFPLRDQNRRVVQEIFGMANTRNPALKNGLCALEQVLLSTEEATDEHNKKAEAFFSRLMQFTGPLMAKGVEDTSMYQYNCFIAHNEVGDAINARGISAEDYHRQMERRLRHWPLSMSTTSTHDTKRGEDVRARLNAISVLTNEWEQLVHQWMQMDQKLKIRLEQGLLEPSLSVEYFVYQTLLGTFPFSGEADETYLQRIDEYLVKALREAKRKVSWSDPDETYENTVCEFTRNMLDPDHDFLESFVPFQQKAAWRGVVNSLAQLVLKCTSPGIPDIYQGTEFWDLSLVDPDNRQPVDYEERHSVLRQLIEQSGGDLPEMIDGLMKNAFNGHIKLWITHLLLKQRNNQPQLFFSGDYIPIEIKGKMKENILSYARRKDDEWFLVIVPLFTQEFSSKADYSFVTDIEWEDTRLALPVFAPGKWKNILTGREIDGREENLISTLFKEAPLVLMTNVD